MKKVIVEGRKSTPVSQRCDVIVVGAGPAGITSALASARRNKKVILVERYGYLGGLITGSYVIHLLGFSNGEKGLILLKSNYPAISYSMIGHIHTMHMIAMTRK